MTRARPPAVAGRFYPADARRLAVEVADHLDAGARRLAAHGAGLAPPPKALIVPHAGYVYSGPVAGTAYAAWRPLKGRVRRVVMLGPAHRHRVRGLAAPTVAAFDGPLGPVPIDRRALDAVAGLPQVVFDDRAHADEHALEVQLPFLQAVLGDFELAPFAVGGASDAEVAEVIDRLWGGPETRVVISSDLSHFLDQATARVVDRATVDAIERLDGGALHPDSACGRVPIRGLLALGARRGLSVRAVDVRSSGDTAGGAERVVGYGAFLVHSDSDSDQIDEMGRAG